MQSEKITGSRHNYDHQYIKFTNCEMVVKTLRHHSPVQAEANFYLSDYQILKLLKMPHQNNYYISTRNQK